MEYAELWKKGLPPVTGGVLDQPAWFRGACRFIYAEDDRAERAVSKT